MRMKVETKYSTKSKLTTRLKNFKYPGNAYIPYWHETFSINANVTVEEFYLIPN